MIWLGLIALILSSPIEVTTLGDINSMHCHEELEIIRNFTVGSYRNNYKFLICNCACTSSEAAKVIHERYVNYEYNCELLFNNVAGICFEQVQENMILYQCPEGGFGHCLIELKAEDYYQVLHLKIKSQNIKIMNEKNQPIDADNFIVQSISCGVKNITDSFYYYFRNIHDNQDKWYEKCEPGETEFARQNLFEIRRDHEYHKTLWKNVNFTDGLCQEKYTPENYLVNKREDVGNVCNIVRKELEFKEKYGRFYLQWELDPVVMKMKETTLPSTTVKDILFTTNPVKISNTSLITSGMNFSNKNDTTFFQMEHPPSHVTEITIISVISCIIVLAIIYSISYCVTNKRRKIPSTEMEETDAMQSNQSNQVQFLLGESNDENTTV